MHHGTSARQRAGSEQFDVVVVGARCAGASLGTLLARHGLKVAVLEQATFPRDTLSSHVIQADSLAFLNRLGLTSQVRATGAPFMSRIDARLEDLRLVRDYPQEAGDVGGAAAVRRHLLDPILVAAAAAAGADVRMATKVTGLVEAAGRVAGVRVVHGGAEHELRAPLVVGADGRRSTVARLCGARAYNVTWNERWYYWSYFEGSQELGVPTFVYHRWGDRLVFSAPADSGLYIVGVSPEAAERKQFRRNLDSSLMEHARSCEPVEAVLADARRACKIFGITRFASYFREAFGPGWVLVGDAGHFKDPSAGRGIGGAFRQVETLAPAIIAGLDGAGEPFEQALARWHRWRDHKFAGHYWMASDLGKAGAVPMMAPETVRWLVTAGRSDCFIDLFSHRSRYYDVFTLPRLAAAAGRLLLRRGCDRRTLLRDLRTHGAQEVRHRWANRRPAFSASEVGVPTRAGVQIDSATTAPDVEIANVAERAGRR